MIVNWVFTLKWCRLMPSALWNQCYSSPKNRVHCISYETNDVLSSYRKWFFASTSFPSSSMNCFFSGTVRSIPLRRASRRYMSTSLCWNSSKCCLSAFTSYNSKHMKLQFKSIDYTIDYTKILVHTNTTDAVGAGNGPVVMPSSTLCSSYSWSTAASISTAWHLRDSEMSYELFKFLFVQMSVVAKMKSNAQQVWQEVQWLQRRWHLVWWGKGLWLSSSELWDRPRSCHLSKHFFWPSHWNYLSSVHSQLLNI